ncbi:MAG TPA: hypothetical protein VMH87_11155 [Pseudomonadales bacterium]|nr:hypothetical protein [Pseudomonadales bacterium]
MPVLRAQAPVAPGETRVLIIFDTSSAMKKRLPNEVKAIKQLFALALAERLQNGDTIGIWTFDSDVHTGEYPLQYWQVQNITPIASSVISFVQSEHYGKTTSFDKLTPLISHVISTSPRILVIIFCDGDGQFKGTPFDMSVNAAFKEHQNDMRKAREPFVIALQGENGQYNGSTISSAEEMNIPHFSPRGPSPQFPTEGAPVSQAPPPAPAPQPLIIIGHPATNAPPPPPTQDIIIKGTPPVTTPAPAPPAGSVQTNAVPQANSLPESKLPETNSAPPVVVSAPATNTVVSSAVVSPPEPPAPTPVPTPAVTPAAPPISITMPAETSKAALFVIAGGILIVAGVPLWVILGRSRRQATSLITESLKKR